MASPPALDRRFLLSAFCFLLCFPRSLLTGLANAWIVNETPEKADAIVVLGGGMQYRPFAAAGLFKKGFAPKVLIMDAKTSPTGEMGITQPERSIAFRILKESGVPENAIETVGREVGSTYDEALAVRQWAKANGAKRLLIATEIFHTRRVRWLFRKVMKHEQVDIRIVAVEPPEYGANNWWKRELGLINFQNEWVKLPFYWIKY